MSSMKQILILFSMFFIALSVQAQDQQEEASAEEPQALFSASSNLTFVNNYYFRGEYLFPDGVPAFQPDLTITFNKIPLSFGTWWSVPLKKRAELQDVKDEVDFYLSTEIGITENLSTTVGVTTYLYPFGESPHTEEIYFTLLYELPYGFAMEGQCYIDIKELKGVYFSFLPTYSTSIKEGMDLKFQTVFSYTNYKGLGAQMPEIGFKAAYAWQFSDYMSLNSSVLYNYNYSLAQHLYAVSLGLGFGI